MVKIECAGGAFKAFESYPETACGKKPKKQRCVQEREREREREREVCVCVCVCVLVLL